MKLSNLVYGARRLRARRAGRTRALRGRSCASPAGSPAARPCSRPPASCRRSSTRPRPHATPGASRPKITGQPAPDDRAPQRHERVPPLASRPAGSPAARRSPRAPAVRCRGVPRFEPGPPRQPVAAGSAAADEAHRCPRRRPAARTAHDVGLDPLADGRRQVARAFERDRHRRRGRRAAGRRRPRPR